MITLFQSEGPNSLRCYFVWHIHLTWRMKKWGRELCDIVTLWREESVVGDGFWTQILTCWSVVLNFWNSGHIYLLLPSTFPLPALPNTANLYPTLEFVRFICSFEFHGDCLSLAQTPSPPYVLFIDQKLYCGLFYDSFFLVFHPISTHFNNLPPACSQN